MLRTQDVTESVRKAAFRTLGEDVRIAHISSSSRIHSTQLFAVTMNTVLASIYVVESYFYEVLLETLFMTARRPTHDWVCNTARLAFWAWLLCPLRTFCGVEEMRPHGSFHFMTVW